MEDLDLENMPLDKLREMAMDTNAELPDQPRDEQGRFAKEEEPKVVDEPDEIVYRREIDLGDGSGKQVFEADSVEGLIEQLAKAQEHATRKIRELSQAREKVETKVDPNEEWQISQEMLATPTETMRKLFERTVGMPITDFKTKMQRLEAFERAAAEEQAGRQFVEAHPEFVKNSQNAQRIERYIRTYKLEGTLENIEKAYQDLSASGLLELKSDDDKSQSRIAEGQRNRAASGISSKRASTVQRSQGPTEEELYTMPYEKLRELALKAEQQQ